MSARRAVYLQAIRGPVLLITLGVLFELQQSGGLPFWKSWPLLLIAIGVMKLIEWAAGGQAIAAADPQPQYAPQTGRTWGGQPYSQPWSGHGVPTAGSPPPMPQTPTPPQEGQQS